MNETKNVEMLYDINEAVRNLNKVEGFEPKKYLREETTEEGKSFYMNHSFIILTSWNIFLKNTVILLLKIMVCIKYL